MRYSKRPRILSCYLLMAIAALAILETGCGHRQSFVNGGSFAPLMAPGPTDVQYASGEFVDGEVVEDALVGEAGCGGSCCGGCAGEMYPDSCGSYATGHRGGISGLFLPLMSTRLACGSGCGGIYWGEWLTDPPECCDPCNDCGCWVEPRCCNHRGALSSCLRSMHAKMKHACHVAIYGYYPKGCGQCEGCDDGCGCDAGFVAGPYEEHGGEYSEAIGPGETIEMEAAPSSVTEQMRFQHGRPPHRVVSRRLRR